MNDIMLSLAIDMQSNKGIYALLLGSGISSNAGIPTGWGIVLDLISKIRAIHPQGQQGNPDLETWYVETYGKQLDYSDLLNEVAKTPASRSLLLKNYFEPTEEEREEGKKLPTPAHKAIAKLVAKGYIKVIITTNFDRLLEQALEAEGITPQVISSVARLKSAYPIVHSPCTIVKVHGDYMEADTKNIVTELETYDEALDDYLDRIFDEFGLIISGWSAEWDTALRNAITRCPSHRFTTYWTDRGRRKTHAQDLIDHRRAEIIKVTGADSFFQELAEKVTSLEEINQKHPLDTKTAVQTLKRYLTEDKYRTKLEDFLLDEIEMYLEEKSKIFLKQQKNRTSINYSIKQHEVVAKRLISIFITLCHYSKSEQERLLSDAFERLINNEQDRFNNSTRNDELKILLDYPNLIIFYAICITATKNKKYELLNSLISKIKHYESQLIWLLKVFPSGNVRSIESIFEKYFSIYEEHRYYCNGYGYTRTKTPVGEHLNALLQNYFMPIMSSKSEYEFNFDRFEYLLNLVYVDYCLQNDLPPKVLDCRFIWRTKIKSIIDTEIENHKENWQPIRAGFFDGSLARFMKARESRCEYQVVEQEAW